jgi:hypothetical protein
VNRFSADKNLSLLPMAPTICNLNPYSIYFQESRNFFRRVRGCIASTTRFQSFNSASLESACNRPVSSYRREDSTGLPERLRGAESSQSNNLSTCAML